MSHDVLEIADKGKPTPGGAPSQAHWRSPAGECFNVFQRRLNGLGKKYWEAWWKIRDGLRVCGVSYDSARTIAARFFPVDKKRCSGVPDITRCVKQGLGHHVEGPEKSDGMFYACGEAMDLVALAAYDALVSGSEQLEDDADWAMSQGTRTRIDISQAPSRRAIVLWELLKKDASKFHQVYGTRLMGSRKSEEEEARDRKLHTDKIEASEFAKMYRELRHLSIEAVMDGEE